MEKRRAAVRLCLAAGVALCAAAAACEPPVKGSRLESPRFVLTFKPDPVAVAKHFGVQVAACAKSGPPPRELKVDALMPEHQHGMNYRPTVKALAAGRWQVSGLMFHMPGKWQFVFDVDGERLTAPFLLSDFSAEELKKILSHGPWPPPKKRDPSNRVSGKLEAVVLGERLFYEPRLSSTGSVLCATCHAPFRAYQDGRPRGVGLEEVERNTPSLINVSSYRWYGWDGGHDTLWSQSIRPLLDPREMRSSAADVAALMRSRAFARGYERAFGRPVPVDDEAVLVDVGKALAAFQETLTSGRTPFDDFRDALLNNDSQRIGDYPDAAKRGLKIFVGKGNCSTCHFGAHFTNGEFADTGVPFFTGRGKVDPGRLGGIKKIAASPYTLLGRFNDDASRSTATGTRHVELQHRNFGEFRVPALRNVALTAPYMHDGSLATLRDVVKHYSELNEERLHLDGEKILRKLSLGDEEIDDLVSFLETLTERGASARRGF